jgi:hypothetical protein
LPILTCPLDCFEFSFCFLSFFITQLPYIECLCQTLHTILFNAHKTTRSWEHRLCLSREETDVWTGEVAGSRSPS